MELKRNEDMTDPKLLNDCCIMQNRRLRLDYKATESGLFSATKLIWGIFISVQMRTKVVREWTYSVLDVDEYS